MKGPLFCLALASAATGCRGERPSADDEREIRAVLDRQRDAWNRGDIDGFMEGYRRSPDTVFTSGGTVRRGFDETIAAYKKKYVSDDAMGQLSFDDVELEPVGPDGAIALGRWTLTETPQAGTGVFTLVFRREAGAWKIVHDHTSALAEPTPPEAKH